MMLPLQEILNKYNVHPKGVIHVGAHWAEEHKDYRECGIEHFVYIEPCKEAYGVLRRMFNSVPEDGTFSVALFNNACGAVEREMPMYVSHQNQGQSNSLLEPVGHLTQHPEVVFDDAEVVKVKQLDNLPMPKGMYLRNEELYTMLVMDVQGYEGEVLKGANETLKHIDIIYTEVNRGQTYAGNMEIDEMDKFLEEYGFKRVETHWPSLSWTWGDAVYVKQ